MLPPCSWCMVRVALCALSLKRFIRRAVEKTMEQDCGKLSTIGKNVIFLRND